MKHLNIAFDNKTPEALLEFMRKISTLSHSLREKVHVKVNDLLAFTGIEGLKDLQKRILEETGIQVKWMIDGKWFDIPNTVGNYVKHLGELNVAYYTVHGSGATEMIRSAKKAMPHIPLLAITVLTSMKENEVMDIYDANRKDTILRIARSALDAGADGLVCAPTDVPMLRAVFSETCILVTPNIAREGTERNDDQNKALTATPRTAIENGATDIVVGRPILESQEPIEVITEMLTQMEAVQARPVSGDQFLFEKILYGEDWGMLLRHIGAIYEKTPASPYVRLASGFLSDGYVNFGATERDYRTVARACHEVAGKIRERGLAPSLVIGAQMGSVRLSLELARALSVTESIYTEKDGKDMRFMRHDLGSEAFSGKRIVLSEDVITTGSTLAKMIDQVNHGGGQVIAITCVVNRTGKEEFQGIPLLSSYTPREFGKWWDEKTLDTIRANALASGKTALEADSLVEDTKRNVPHISEGAVISEKPKNEWNTLITSMRY